MTGLHAWSQNWKRRWNLAEHIALDLAGETLALLPQRALWWPRCQTVFVADVHIGKAAAFRKLGVPVPIGTTDDTLERLQALLHLTAAGHLVVLGDLFHSEHVQQSDSLASFGVWRGHNAHVKMTLVRGNHDARSGDPPAEMDIACVEAPVDFGGLWGLHEPDEHFTLPSLAGHLHPAIRLSGRGRDSVRLPCFVRRGDQVILPAFGAFTGMHTLKDLSGLQVFPVSGQAVFKMPSGRQV